MKKIKVNYLLSLVFTTLISSVWAQEKLSLNAAIEEALKNNFSVQIAKNNVAIAQNEATTGNAGMLPSLSMGAGESFSVNNTQQKLNSGNEINRKGAQSTNTNAGISLNWTLFDGFRMFIAHERLKALGEAEELLLRQQMEKTIQKEVEAYLEILKQQELLTLADTAILIYSDRTKLSKNKWEIGISSKMDFLQSSVDLNEQKSSRLNQLLALENAKTYLNTLLGRKSEKTFEVETSITLRKDLNLEQLKQKAASCNANLSYLKKDILVSELALKEIRSGFFPRLVGNAGYNYARSTNQASFIQLNQNTGLNLGLSLGWTVFDGLNLRRKIRTAQLGIVNQKLFLENSLIETESAVSFAYRKYFYALQMLALEEENLQVAKESAVVARERYKTGSSTFLELKDIEKSFLDAKSRLVNAEYLAKIAETELLRLSGHLLNAN